MFTCIHLFKTCYPVLTGIITYITVYIICTKYNTIITLFSYLSIRPILTNFIRKAKQFLSPKKKIFWNTYDSLTIKRVNAFIIEKNIMRKQSWNFTCKIFCKQEKQFAIFQELWYWWQFCEIFCFASLKQEFIFLIKTETEM